MARRQLPHRVTLLGVVLLFSAALRGAAQEPSREHPQTGTVRISGSAAQTAAAGGVAPARQTLVRGKVLDSSRASVAGATVTLSGVTKDLAASTSSDDRGEFSLQVDPAVYAIEILAEGFPKLTLTVDLRYGATAPLEFVLQVQGRHDTILVTTPSGYQSATALSGTKTVRPLLELPQSITVVTQGLLKDQLTSSIGDLVRYVPGITAHQGENNRDQVVIRGSSSSADFFIDGVRDDVQYYRDLYNTERVEALKGPNAMAFGRGGGGGVINRVTKEAGFTPLTEVAIQGGTHANRRFTADFDRPLGAKFAFRLNGVLEKSDSFRSHVNLDRRGLSPTVTITPGTHTRITLAYEHFRDRRIADRGIPSFQGRPADVDLGLFFGDPGQSRVRARVNIGAATLEQRIAGFEIRNRTLIADYDRGYQNFVPGAVTPDRTAVSLSAYNNATGRRNYFNQTDLHYAVSTGGMRHLLLAGAEIGRQLTHNLRHTGFFNGLDSVVTAPLDSPTIVVPVIFRQSRTDADNRVRASVASAYLQDQVQLSRRIRALAGFRVDRFDLRHLNNRTAETLGRLDYLVSPRAGIVYFPITSLSVYGSYAVSFLPSSGDQFSSLTSVTQQMKPEKFSNYELGAKWDFRHRLSLSAAAFRLDRTNTRATDPADPARIVQTGSQRTTGCEVGWNGLVTRAWDVAGGFAWQDAVVVSDTANARAGARTAQVPRFSWSLWNSYRFHRKLGGGLGILNRSDMFAAVDNRVTLPGYTRADAALYYIPNERLRLQVNVENLFDRRYFLNANGNNNISPGWPRAIRLAVTIRF